VAVPENFDVEGERPPRRSDRRRTLFRDLAIAVLAVAIFFAGLFAFTQVWPPLVVVESSSMQHSDVESYVGVVDTGDLVLVQAAPARDAVVTWVQGRVSGHSTYGDYGDVIIFRKPGTSASSTPIIHRAILYIVPNGTDAYDVPDLTALPSPIWEGYDRNGSRVESAYGLRSVTIHGMGWRRDLGITFNLAGFAQLVATRGRSGYVTMGDHNADSACQNPDPCLPFPPYDQGWLVPQENIVGRARGEIPWFGLIKLMAQPSGSCCQGWGDPAAPANSWNSLLVALVLLIAAPFALEGIVWAVGRYVAPRFRRGREEPESGGTAADDNPGPKGGSSGP